MHVFYTGHLVDPQGPFGRMFRKLRIQGRMYFFEKIMSQKALNRVLTPESSGGSGLPQSPLKIMDLQNKNISVVKKHKNGRISSPMSDISWLDIREIWKGTLVVKLML